MTPVDSVSDHRVANRNAALRWGTFVVGMLGLQVIGGVTAIILASSDKSVAVVPGYHEKALHWDDEIAIQTASNRLGWVAEVTQTNENEASDEANDDEANAAAGLQIQLRDQSGQWVAIESGTIEIYRHVRAAEVRRVRIPAAVIGAIDLSDCFDVGGLWQVSLDVHDAAGNRFVDSREIDVLLPTSHRGSGS